MSDTYKTINTPAEGIRFKEKNSKFYGYCYPVNSEEEIKFHLEEVKKKHPNARHWCYAWQLGITDIRYRANDDGEPSHTAGTPIYGQLQSFGVTNTLVIVVRYFGGVKLGVGGLIQAYKTTARDTLAASEIVTKTTKEHFELRFEYKDMNTVMRIIKEQQLEIVSQHMTLECTFVIAVPKKGASPIWHFFKNRYGITIQKHS